MSIFADCRNDSYYNEDFLADNNKEFVSGADWMKEQIINLFENNLDVYKGTLEYEGDIDIDKVLDKAKEEIAAMITDWCEMERNMLITSLIEGMEEYEYEASVKSAIEKNKKKDKPKEYYDTKHFMCTGEKVFRN